MRRTPDAGLIAPREPMRFENPPAVEMHALLRRVHTIAVVGLSPRPDRPSYRIARRLKDWGYRVIPVRPEFDAVHGEKAYARLADLLAKPDLVNVFLAAPAVGPIVEQCIALGLAAIWMQEGIVNEAAAGRARAVEEATRAAYGTPTGKAGGPA